VWQRVTPPQVFIGSFAVLIVLGGIGFRLLPGLFVDQVPSWTDCFFTSTSAVCVTGLSVFDVATRMTLVGQAFLLLQIQLGGLGMLTFASLIIMALGRRLSLRHEETSIVASETSYHIDRRRLTRDIVRFTFLFEVIGAIALYAVWVPRLGWDGAAWPAVFHSVSAFCNAGFSTFSDNLAGFYDSALTLMVVLSLITAGGVGFLTHEELYLKWRAFREKRAFRVSLQSRIVLITSVLLIFAGFIGHGVFEWNRTLSGMTVWQKVWNSVFMSVTTRTAGFNTIDYSAAGDSANLLTMLLMTIGGSPGSTAGGIKTTTFALIGLVAISRLRAQETTNVLSRSIPEETTDRAVGLFAIAAGIMVAGVFGLTITEDLAGRPYGLMERMFEAVSAFNTVGLSMGITSTLSNPGRWVTILLMFFGRVGPLTLAAALTRSRSKSDNFRYAYEEVIVG
jgi:trk system potassium uptake protein TrkH